MSDDKQKKSRQLGFLAGQLIGKMDENLTEEDKLALEEFKTSTQKMGVQMSDKVRDIFRKNWIKKSE